MFGRKTRWCVISIHVFLYFHAVCTNYMFCILKSLRHNKKKSTQIQASLLFLIKKLQFSFSDKEKKIICHFFFFYPNRTYAATFFKQQIFFAMQFKQSLNSDKNIYNVWHQIVAVICAAIFFTLIAHKSRFSHTAQMTTFHCRLFFIYVMFIRESDDWVTTTP